MDKYRYTIVEKEGREEFIKDVFAQQTHFHIPQRETPLSRAIIRRWPGTLWCQIRREAKKVFGQIFPALYPWVAKISTKAGRVVAWRNGGDRGDYNFLVYVEATKEFHPRPNVRDVIDLIAMIDSPEDAALFIGQKMGKRNMAYLERILK